MPVGDWFVRFPHLPWLQDRNGGPRWFRRRCGVWHYLLAGLPSADKRGGNDGIDPLHRGGVALHQLRRFCHGGLTGRDRAVIQYFTRQARQ